MKLSTKIHEEIDAAHPFKTAVINTYELCAWEAEAEDIEADARAAWRSFWVACAVTGLAIAYALGVQYGWLFGHTTVAATPRMRPDPALVVSLAPERIEVSPFTEVTEL